MICTCMFLCMTMYFVQDLHRHTKKHTYYIHNMYVSLCDNGVCTRIYIKKHTYYIHNNYYVCFFV